MLKTNIKELKVSMKGLNGTKHIDKVDKLRKKGWIGYAVAFNSEKMVTEYHFRRPASV